MELPDKRELLAELDRLDYRERTHRVSSLAHLHRDEPGLDALLDALEAGDVYERGLALRMALVAGRRGRALRALRSGSVRLETGACHLGRTADARTLAALLPEVAPAIRRRLLAQVARKRRTSVADDLLPLVLDRFGARAAARLLRACSEAPVRRTLPQVAHAITDWRWLAAAHAGPVLDYLRDRQTAAAAPRAGEPWDEVATALPVLAVSRPGALIDLTLETLAGDVVPPPLARHLGILARRAPERIGEILLHPGFRRELLRRGLSAGVLRRLRHLPAPLVRDLARPLLAEPGHLAALLEALPPSRREAVFRHACDGIDVAHRRWPEELLAALPHAVRNAEARRMLGLRSIRQDSQRTLEVTAYRDVEAVRPELEQAARSPQADRRRQALALLVECTGRSRRGLTATLDFLGRIKNDQDGVRRGVFAALADLPLSLFAAKHWDALRELVEHALAARDTSWPTRSAIESLAWRLFAAGGSEPREALFRLALDLLRRLAESTGHLGSLGGFLGRFGSPSLHRSLPRGAEGDLYAALEPAIRAAAENGDFDLAIGLARSLGERAWRLESLQDWLEKAAGSRPDWTARQAIELWLADPTRRDQRVRRLLDREPSSICLEPVLHHLHQRRQTWLEPYLEGKPPRGRFARGKEIFVPPLKSGFHRWLPRQQRAFRRTLLRVAGDEGSPMERRVAAVRTLARLPSTETGDLRRFLSAAEIPLVEAALGALAWLDRPADSLPILLDHLDGDRARVAMYALPRCARRIAPRQMLQVLRHLLQRDRLKVTVHKEIVRLLGENRAPGAMAALAAAWDRGELHRDVRIAFAHAARRRIERPEVWAMLETLAGASDAQVARSLLEAGSGALPIAQRPRYARLLLRVAGHPDAELAAEAFRALADWTEGVEEAVIDAACRAIADLEGGVVWQGTLEALLAAVRGGAGGDALKALARALRTAPVPDAHDAGAERDRPARRRLTRLVGRLVELSPADRGRLRSQLLGLAAELAEDPTLWPAAARLEIGAIDWRRPREAAAALTELIARTDRASRHFLPRIPGEVASVLRRDPECWQPADAEALLAIVDATDSPPARHLEMAVLKAAADRTGWLEPLASRLRALRRHPDVGVRTDALDLATCPEERPLPRLRGRLRAGRRLSRWP